MILALFIIPITAAALSLCIRTDRLRRYVLVGAAGAHTVIASLTWLYQPAPILNGWFELDAAGRLFLTITSVLFLAAAFYAAGYLKGEKKGKQEFIEEGDHTGSPLLFVNAPEAIFTACILCFLGTMTMVHISRHFGLIWVSMEATTLVSAPLIYFHRHHRSLEATWKYLLICSVGIAIALLGNFFLAIAASNSISTIPLLISDLTVRASQLNIPWVKAAFIFFLVGYGTKMGLAPMHTWLPDAHSEAPSVVSALLSGALLNCAFVGILRAFQVCAAAGHIVFAQDLLVLFGLVSMACAAIFIIGQPDYKRMLAYSSVEHMGILAFGVGLGGSAIFGAMIHAINHSLTKATLFLVAGNILALYKSKLASDVRGLIRVIPVSGILWVAGILAIAGFPPFGTFISEFTILKSSLEQGRVFASVAYLVFLSIIFVGISTIAFKMAQGHPAETFPITKTERRSAIIPPLAMILAVLMFGVFMPSNLSDALHEVARVLGGN
jgi:hydrogenase-4 component F